ILVNGGRGLSKSLVNQDTLFSKLLNNSGFKSHFVQRFAAHLNSTFKPSRMSSLIDSITEILTPEMEEYVSKWKSDGGIRSVSSWKTSVDSVKKFMEERGQYVFEHLSSSKFTNAGTAELTINLSNPDGGEIHINQVRMSQGLSAMTFFKSIPLQMKAVAKPGYVFAGWSEGGSEDSITLTLTGNKTIEAKFEKAQDHPVPSSITENTKLNLTDHPYVTDGDIFVAKGATLTIEKGVTLLMPQDADIDINGRLLINGTSDAPVKIKTNNIAGATNWGAINFNNVADTCKLTYVEISGTTLGDDALNERGGINGNNSNVVMDHLTITDVIYPFYFEGGSTVLRNSSIIIDHICNGGIHIGRGGAIVENNYWISTGKTINTDAIDIKGVENGIIRGNRLYNFNGFNSDGIDLGEGAKNILVEGNYIFGNRDKGISCGGASTCIVRNNIVVACDLGIGIKDEGSKAELDHNTFVRNRIAVAVYTKVFGRGGGTAVVKNCILSVSKGASFYKDEFSSITLSYCISDKDILPGTGNLFGDPKFTDILNNNFQLAGNSPCLNTGDPSSPKDNDGTVTEIGAQYTFSKDDFPSSIAAPYCASVV
ncbi:MAG TPA: right-handed parallel beta-helix repeat-containing protein, partial [Chitinispirillaceae bacterium]|nr:right-handed parallel beta-helix repeat-containing protein [Chitinispirillaceae bacterium]